VRIVVRNDDTSEYYIQAEQIFGKTANGDLYPAYRLDQSIERIRQSELGEAMARGAATVGTAGGLSGASASADATTYAIKRELRKVDWGNRVVYGGRIEHGFLFMKPGVAYEALEVLIYNVNKRENTRVSLSVR